MNPLTEYYLSKTASPLSSIGRFLKLHFSPSSMYGMTRSSLKRPLQAIKAQSGFFGKDVEDFYKAMSQETGNKTLKDWAANEAVRVGKKRVSDQAAISSLKKIKKDFDLGEIKGLDALKGSLKPGAQLVGNRALPIGIMGLDAYLIKSLAEQDLEDYQRGNIGGAQLLGSLGGHALSSVTTGPWLANINSLIGTSIAGNMAGAAIDEKLKPSQPQYQLSPEYRQYLLDNYRMANVQNPAFYG